MTPATAIRVITYGSAWKSVAAEAEYTGSRKASAVERPKSSAAPKAPNGPPVPEDERRERDEASAGGHVLVEGAEEADEQVRAAAGGQHPREDD